MQLVQKNGDHTDIQWSHLTIVAMMQHGPMKEGTPWSGEGCTHDICPSRCARSSVTQAMCVTPAMCVLQQADRMCQLGLDWVLKRSHGVS